MIEELVQRVFTARDQAHLAHWATKSYSEHKALNDFYSDVLDSLDAIVENYQGFKGLLKSIKVKGYETPNAIVDILKEDVKWLNTNRSTIANNIASIENLVDELTSVYTKAIYKLVNLK